CVTELATSAISPFGLIATLVGGPNIEFSSAMLVKIFGFSRSPISTKEIVSFPGAEKTAWPTSSHNTFSSLPDTITCEPAAVDRAKKAPLASAAIVKFLCCMAHPPCNVHDEALVTSWRPAILDNDIVTFDPAEVM